MRSTNLYAHSSSMHASLFRLLLLLHFYPQFLDFNVHFTYSFYSFIHPSVLLYGFSFNFFCPFSCCTAAFCWYVYNRLCKTVRALKKITQIEKYTSVSWCERKMLCMTETVHFSVLCFLFFLSLSWSLFSWFVACFSIDHSFVRSFIHVSKNTLILIHDTSHT